LAPYEAGQRERRARDRQVVTADRRHPRDDDVARHVSVEDPVDTDSRMLCTPYCVLNVSDGQRERKLCTPGVTQLGMLEA